MSSRFCDQCGTQALASARFCAQCGAPLGSSGAGGWQLTLAGSALLTVFLAAGLTVWTLILVPSQRSGPGGPAPRAATATATPAPPAQKADLPAEVKSFITDLAAKAKAKPDDLESWLKLAQVYARASQLDPSYQGDATTTFEHVLDIDPKQPEALRGLANIHYDREDHQKAIPIYERYLDLRPDDLGARTDLGTMYLYAGQGDRAIGTYQDVIRRNPSFLQAHYNLAVTYHGQGKDGPALSELEVARGLATEEPVKKQIDDMIATLKGGGRPAPEASDGAPASFQGAVEQAFRAHPIMGPRIVRFEWSSPASGKVMVQNFPMEGMPDDVRAKFTDRLAKQLRTVEEAHPVEGQIRVEIADAASGKVMATVTP